MKHILIFVKKILTLAFFIALTQQLYAQNTFTAIVTDDKTQHILPGATVRIPALKLGSIVNKDGLVTITNIPNGDFQLLLSFIGYRSQEKKIHFPLHNPAQPSQLALEPAAGELSEVTVETTRTNQNMKDIPTRIEALPLEEIDEKSSVKPGDIRLLLGEVTGINVQQNSAVSGTANFRIQGLDSRYTQLLKDGMPLYQGFSSGLSLLQISPLDLKQVEFIKGSASTLYGGGAIAGIINLISRTPKETPELNIMLNGTNAGGRDASAFYTREWKHFGTTVYSAYNYNASYDPAKTGLSAIPQTYRFTVNPKIFLVHDSRNSGWVGINSTYEDRYGGDMQVIEGRSNLTHQYFERNRSVRLSTQLSFTHIIDSISRFTVKNTIGTFDRTISNPGVSFRGKQLSSFTEFNFVRNRTRSAWVAGVNFISDQFRTPGLQPALNYSQQTAGIFGQNTYKLATWVSIETGLRVDVNSPASFGKAAGIFVLPRLNTLFRVSEKLTSRIGGGMGYKMPSIFNDQSEQQCYQHLSPISIRGTRAEESSGFNGDLSYRSPLGDSFITINELLFYTQVSHPLLLEENRFSSSTGHIISKGSETNIKLSLDELAFYLGYTYTDARLNLDGQARPQPLTPRHRLNFDGIYELEKNFRIGAECFYTSSQLLSDGTTGRNFVTIGLLAQKMWKHLDIFVNFENLTDRRQTRWGSVYSGSITRPVFKDIYTPLDGVIANLGIRIKLLN